MLILILRTHDIMIFGGMNGKNSGNEFRAEGENDEMSAPNYRYHDWNNLLLINFSGIF